MNIEQVIINESNISDSFVELVLEGKVDEIVTYLNNKGVIVSKEEVQSTYVEDSQSGPELKWIEKFGYYDYV